MSFTHRPHDWTYINKHKENIAGDEQAAAEFNDWRARSVNLLRRLNRPNDAQTYTPEDVYETLKQLFEPQ